MNNAFLRPRHDREVVIRKSLFNACRQSACAAALLSVLTDGEITRDKLLETVVAYRWPSVERSLKSLMVLKFIEYEMNGETINITVHHAEVNAVLETYDVREAKPAVVPTPKPKETVSDPKAMSALRVLEYRNRRRAEFWALRGCDVRGTSPAAHGVLDCLRAALDQYSEDDLKLAVEGNLASEWHQGANDRTTVYDGVDWIFKDMQRIERFITKANSLNIQLSAAPDNTDYNKAVVLLLPVALGTCQNIELCARQLRVLCPELDFKKLAPILIKEVENAVGIYEEAHRTRLREFVSNYK